MAAPRKAPQNACVQEAAAQLNRVWPGACLNYPDNPERYLPLGASKKIAGKQFKETASMDETALRDAKAEF